MLGRLYRSTSDYGEEIPGFARNETLCRAVDVDGFQSRLKPALLGKIQRNPSRGFSEH